MTAAPGWLMLKVGDEGEAGNRALAVWPGRLRRQQGGIEVEVYDPTLAAAEALARQLTSELTMPAGNELPVII